MIVTDRDSHQQLVIVVIVTDRDSHQQLVGARDRKGVHQVLVDRKGVHQTLVAVGRSEASSAGPAGGPAAGGNGRRW